MQRIEEHRNSWSKISVEIVILNNEETTADRGVSHPIHAGLMQDYHVAEL